MENITSTKDLVNQRKKATIKKYGTLLLVLGLYGIYCCFSTIRIPCVFHLVTGLDCPGCGMTRASVAVLHFDFAKAWHYNKLLFIVIPALAYIIGKSELQNIKYGEVKYSKSDIIILSILMVVTIAYGILRNIFPL